jgi:hypothetical protein
LGASARPKPSSRGDGACSNSRTDHPAFRKARAADSPPMPAPTISAVRGKSARYYVRGMVFATDDREDLEMKKGSVGKEQESSRRGKRR